MFPAIIRRTVAKALDLFGSASWRRRVTLLQCEGGDFFEVTVSEAILEPDKFRTTEPKPATIRKYLQELKRPTLATNVSWKVSLLLKLALEWPKMGQAVAQAMHQERKAKTLAEQ